MKKISQALHSGYERLPKDSGGDVEMGVGSDASIDKRNASHTSQNKGNAHPSKDGGETKKKTLSLVQFAILLFPYFWPNKGADKAVVNRIRSSATWIMVALSKVCTLCAPLFLAKAADAVAGGRLRAAVSAMLAYCLLRFSASFCKEMQSILYIKVRQQANIELQELIFSHLLGLSLNWHLSKKTGSVMKSMDRGVEGVNSMVSTLFLFLIPALCECLAVVILFFSQYKQWELGLLVTAGVILYALVTIFITQWRKKFREQTNKHDNDYHDKATDTIINFETVKYFSGERHEVRRYKESVMNFQKFRSSTQLSLSLLNLSQQLILNATVFGTMWVAASAVVNGHMSVGGWVAVQSWVSSVFAPLNYLGSVYGSLYQALIDVTNLSELLAETPDIVDTPGAPDIPISRSAPQLLGDDAGTRINPYTAPRTSAGFSIENDQDEDASSGSPACEGGASLEFRGVYFHYPEQPPEKGLQDVSIFVPPGSTTAIVGHTGAGKTTISRLLFRFYDPLRGSVQLNGLDIRAFTQRSVRESIGIVPQDTVLFNDTIKYNIAYGRLDASFDEIQAAAEAAQIRKFVESLPEQWDTVVGERGLKLSGGEKQRVAIARCLLKNPPIVLLDEATSALDTITENSIQEALQTLGHNRTVVVIAHRLSTIKHADQIVVMGDGRVMEVGSHDELLAKPESTYAQMWNMQSIPTQSAASTPNSTANSPIGINAVASRSDRSNTPNISARSISDSGDIFPVKEPAGTQN